jgi:hypothetical protein
VGVVTPVGRFGIYAMLDDAMINAFGFPQPLPMTRALLRAGLRLRGRVVRWLPPRRSGHFFTDNGNRTHPGGYQISALGPPKLVAAEQRHRAVDDRRTLEPERR